MTIQPKDRYTAPARAAVRAAFGPGAKEFYLLHPPILRALGRKDTLRLDPWFRPAFGPASRGTGRERGS